MSKTALITGATGFIGSHLCDFLYQNDYHVIGVGVHQENIPKFHHLHVCSLANLPFDELPDIDVCFHQAANNDTTDLNVERMNEANVSQTEELFHKLYSLKGCKQFVYASSCSVYGNRAAPYVENSTVPEPLNPYAKSKLMMEQAVDLFCEQTGATAIGLRYSNVYGPGEQHKGKRASMIHQMIETVMQGKQPSLFKWGEQRRDWVYVDDVVHANLLASFSKQSYVYNVGSGDSVSFVDLANYIAEATGKMVEPTYKDNPFTGAYQNYTAVDLSNIKAGLGYKPRFNVRDGIKELYKKRGGN
jgi:ADP-L-glycero-D-manno-heptose 6-epimerase